MSGVGAAILEGQEHAQHESVRVYLSQSVLPAITEALTAMEKERCPNPVPHPFAAFCLTCTRAAQSRTTSHLACGQARGASQSEDTKLRQGGRVDAYVYDAHQAAVAVLSCATLVTAPYRRAPTAPTIHAREYCNIPV